MQHDGVHLATVVLLVESRADPADRELFALGGGGPGLG